LQASTPEAPAAATKLTTAEEYSSTELRQWVTHAFKLAGFPEDAELGLVQMAAMIEGRLDEFLARTAELPQGAVEEREKAREKERRQVKPSYYSETFGKPGKS
jgi:hypothetical protein